MDGQNQRGYGSQIAELHALIDDTAGNVFSTGYTTSTDFPVTQTAYQTVFGGGTGDATLILLSAQFDRLLYCTYLGGVSDDHGRTGFIGKDGSLYISGQTNGSGWPVKNAFQNTYAGGDADIILAKFVPPRKEVR